MGIDCCYFKEICVCNFFAVTKVCNIFLSQEHMSSHCQVSSRFFKGLQACKLASLVRRCKRFEWAMTYPYSVRGHVCEDVRGQRKDGV